jgi:hypothetical protein
LYSDSNFEYLDAYRELAGVKTIKKGKERRRGKSVFEKPLAVSL